MYRRLIPLAALCSLLLSLTAWAQTDRGTITGRITDNTGASVAGASITITNVATGTKSNGTTNAEGLYTIPALTVGTYKINVEKTGFKKAEVTNIIVTVGSTIGTDVALEVGQVTETVQITSDAAQLQTENAKISSAVSNKQVDQLPLVVAGSMRSPFDLSLLTPEAKPLGLGGQAGVGGPGYDSTYSLGGGQGGSWGVTLDGASSGTSRFGSTEWASLNTPSIDAITEFSVDTNGFKADSGRGQGGSLNFVSKSGTNELHGTAYEYLRNNWFDARNYFEDKRSVLKQHDFGGSVGGPVWIPKIYNGKNKTFFFVSAEWFRNRSGANDQVFTVPTPEMYQGDFRRWVDPSGNPQKIYDPATTRANPNYNSAQPITENNPRFIRDQISCNGVLNVICQNRFSALATRYLQYVGQSVLPNAAGAPGTYAYVNRNYRVATGSTLTPWTKWSAKIDHNFSEKHKLSGLYNYALSEVLPGVDGPPTLPLSVSNFRFTKQDSHTYRVNYTWTVTPNIINYAYGGVNWWKQFNYTPNIGGGWQQKGICLTGVFNCDYNLLNLEFQGDGYTTWGGSAGDGSENPVFTFGDDLTIIKGRHTFKAGYMFERLHYNGFGRQSFSGVVRPSRRQTSIPESTNSVLGGGNAFASFLLGQVESARTENDRIVRQYWRGHAGYFQDDWKVNSKLTLNLGLRFETTLPPLERDDKWSDFSPTTINPATGTPGALIFAGFNAGEAGKRTLVPGWYKGFGPRFGFAYSHDEKTVIRGGAGRSFGYVRTTGGSAHFAGAITIWDISTPDGINTLFPLDTGFTGVNAAPQPPSTNPAFSNNGGVDWWQGQEVSRLPETWSWNLSVQRELPKQFLAEITYNGSAGAHLYAGLLNYNQLPSRYITDPRVQPLLSSRIDAPAVVAAGFSKPYASFPNNFSLDRALRPFPQYTDISTGGGNGDRSGHSSYHALVTKIERRVSNGLYLQGSYVFSKLLSDSDRVDGSGRAMDHYNRRWEKSVSEFDLPHNFKFSWIYNLPFGKGQKWDVGKAANLAIGGWRFSAIHVYTSGQPIQLTGGGIGLGGRSAAVVKTLDNWVADIPDNPNIRATSGYTSYFNALCSIAANCNAAGAVVNQPTVFGQAPRFNGKARRQANLGENISMQKSFFFTESFKLDFRWEMFNIFNRVVFDSPQANITSATFGRITNQFNSPRRMQFGLKLYF